MIEQIEKKHRKIKVCRGKKHTFVGMDIEFLDNGKVSILMQEYLKEAIVDLNEDVSCGATLPEAKNLFEVDNKKPSLSNEKAELFHSIVAMLLFYEED